MPPLRASQVETEPDKITILRGIAEGGSAAAAVEHGPTIQNLTQLRRDGFIYGRRVDGRWSHRLTQLGREALESNGSGDGR